MRSRKRTRSASVVAPAIDVTKTDDHGDLQTIPATVSWNRILAGRYELEAQIGRGGFGIVFRAYDRATESRVALKLVHPEIAGRRSWLSHLGREVRHAREVHHPNVCRIFELVEAEGHTFLIMELAAGGSLRQTLARAPRRSIASRMADALGVAGGMAAIHAAGILHRDLKPENILRMRDGRLVVADFGLAEHIRSGRRPSAPGTQGYIAPELSLKRVGATPASDVWGLGIVLHEILFGCRPPETDGGRVFSPHTLALRNLCLACASVDPARRPSDAGEVLRRLEELDGQTLDRRLSRGALPAVDALTLAARLLDVTATRPRNTAITPAHILVPRRPDAPVRLLDRASRTLSRSGAEVLYLSPERSRDEGDARADIFAVGCVIHECLTGRAPDGGLPALEVRARRALGHAVNLSAAESIVPMPVLRLLARMLHPEGVRRPDARRCAAILRALIDTVSVDGAKPTTNGALTAERRVGTVVAVQIHGDHAGRRREDSVRKIQGAAAGSGTRFFHRGHGLWVAAVVGSGTPYDLATRAARCALAVKDSASGVLIGLASGAAVEEADGAVGEAVERAAALVAHAAAGAPRVDASTARLLGTRFEITGGEGFLLVREMPTADRPCTVLGKEIPCVGRDREIGTLLGLWDEVTGEPVARAVLVTARAGAGKSRLRHEFLERIQARPERFEPLIGRGDSVRAGAPFAVLGPALRAAAGLVGGEPAAVQQKRILAHVERYVPAPIARRVAAFIGEIADVPFADQDLPQLRAARQDPRLMADQTLGAWLDFIEAECAAHPVLLVLDDLHWGDGPSVQLVDAALRTLRGRPLLVLAFARPEVDDRFPGLWFERDLQRMALAPLTPRSALKLVEHILGELPAEKAAWIVERADGNPFYLEELVRAVGDGAGPETGQPLPDTVIGMVQARFDALGSDAKRILRAGAVFGHVFRASGVRALVGDDDRSLDQSLDILAKKEVILPRQAAASDEFVFRHALVQEAAYAMLASEDCVLGHRLAGEHLEREGERAAIVLVEHFEKGAEPAKAAHWCRLAAEEALEANDLAMVIERAERGVRLGAAGESLGAMRVTEAQARFWRGEYREAESAALEATQLLVGVDRLRAVREVVAALGQQAKFAEVESWSLGLLERPQEAHAMGAWLDCLVRAAGYLLPGGWYGAVRKLLDEVERQKQYLEAAAAARLQGVHATYAWHEGHHTKVLASNESAAQAYESLGDVRSVTERLADVGAVLGDLGLLEEAEEKLTAVLSAAQRMELGFVSTVVLMNLCQVRAHLGHFDQARAAGEKAVALARKQGDPRIEGGTNVYLSTNACLQGRLMEAEAYARAATKMLENIGPVLPAALAALSRSLLYQGKSPEALVPAEEAYRLLEVAGGVEDGEASIRLAYAESLSAVGREREAERVIRDAWQRLTERAAAIQDPSWREKFLSRLPDHARTAVLARRLVDHGATTQRHGPPEERPGLSGDV
jgi:eukaryotic-like serine/threonine-protein kinase